MTTGGRLNETSGKLKAGRRVWGAADAVVAGSAALVSAILAVFVLLCFQGYSQTVDEMKAKAQRSASIVADGSKWIVTSTRSVLETVTDRYAVSQNVNDAIEAFKSSARPLPAAFTLGIYDQSGALVASANGSVPPNIADRDYFRTDTSTWRLGAQEPGVAGDASFAVAKPLIAEAASVGALVVFVKASVLEQMAAPQDLGAGSTISIVRDDGWIVARNPPLDGPTTISGTDGLEQIQHAETGSYVSNASPIDGVSHSRL